MSAEIRRADWRIHYPEKCDAESVPAVLKPLTRVENGWDAFPWHLTGQFVSLLENPESNFEYLYLTSYFLARAAQVTFSGHIVDHQDLHRALSRYRVQVGGMYREHLLFHVRRHLVKHNLTKLPTCQTNELDPAHDAEQEARDRAEVQKLAMLWEYELGRTLTHLSVATSLEEVVTNHPVKYWASGAGMADGLDVMNRAKWQDGTCILRPSDDDLKRFIRERLPLKTIVERPPEESGGKAESGKRGEETCGGIGVSGCRREEAGGPASADGDIGRRRGDRAERGRKPAAGIAAGATTPRRRSPGETGSHLEEIAKVIGDFKVIRIPGRRPINLAKKHKTRAVVRFIHEALKKAGKTDFYADDMREAFNAQFTGTMAGRQWISDRFREDLFKGKEDEFDLMFEPLDKSAGHYRTKLLRCLSQCGLVALTIVDWLQWGIGEMVTGFVGDGLLGAAGMV